MVGGVTAPNAAGIDRSAEHAAIWGWSWSELCTQIVETVPARSGSTASILQVPCHRRSADS